MGNRKKEPLLPIGSVVVLKEAIHPVAIMGRVVASVDGGKVFDYCAVPYPQGYLDADHLVLFDHDAIMRLVFVGYRSEEEIEFERVISNEVKRKRG